MSPNALLGSVLTFEVRYIIPLVWEPDVGAAARLVERWAQKFATELCKTSYDISQANRVASSHSDPRPKFTATPKAIF